MYIKIELFLLDNGHQIARINPSVYIVCLALVFNLTTVTRWHTDIDTKFTFAAMAFNEKTNLQIKWWSSSVEALLTRSSKRNSGEFCIFLKWSYQGKIR